MNIQNGESLLFQEWTKKREPFVSDGVVNPNEFGVDKSSPKIVYIMKETNALDWDLRRFLKEKGGRGPTWNNIVRWNHAIRHRNNEINWNTYKRINKDFRKAELQKLCILNLKKTPGEGSTKYNQLEKVAIEDKDFILRQYNLYNPNITVCCGTGDLFFEIIQAKDEVKWERTSQGIYFFECNYPNKHYLFSTYHPQARIKAKFLLYRLLDAVREIVP